jgi:predicted  nucleic acid-binding Zn-ribbon protein
MELVDELGKLHAVQKVDAQIYVREQALKALDSGEALKAEAIALMKRDDAAKAELNKASAVLKDKELELKGVETKRATVHDKLYSGRVTNPKELGDLQKDEEMLDHQISKLEEDVLVLMDAAEAARSTEAALAEKVTDAKRKWKTTVDHTTAETARLQKELAALRPLRAVAAQGVDKNLLRRYDDIRSRREGYGLAVTDNDTCPLCHVKLTPQTLDRLRTGEELTLCDSCGRILARPKAQQA